MKKLLKKLGLALLIVFVLAQFFGPEKNQGDLASVDAFLAETNPPEDVKVILKNACFDCHSDNTTYPWYNAITPVNYWLNDHIKHGKGHFNVSKWNDYSLKKKDHKLDELIEEVEEKEMPLPSYTWTHGDADLSPEQIEAVVTWAKQVRTKYALQIKQPQ
ncbi:heme-binding domain-containing protein [Winogradskyella jejuensis]|uniref:Haem-binding domain-containing protein n=1 Tax=Winogradskyella jejuensis TaxID=1089305 RepID=A0A1M5T084_9FLAO|nr:heme-binding domain-containing protein [Winogradskyella jejuensis]SHH44197.1 Haem-binding domain-containing protein [Winogradskyella jejuensis]